MRINKRITIIHHRQSLKRVKPERKMFQFGKLHRPGADGAWPEAAAGSIGHRIILRDTADNDINTGKLATVTPPRKAERATIGHFNPSASRIIIAECLITLLVILAHALLLMCGSDAACCCDR